MDTPLRAYLVRHNLKAVTFANDHGLSPWSVRHWARGNKLPELANQEALAVATRGEVTPAAWLEWKRGGEAVAA